MKKRFAFILIIIFAVSFFVRNQTAESEKRPSPQKQSETFSEIKPQSVQAIAFGISPKISDFASASPETGGTSKKSDDEKARDVPNNVPFRKLKADAVHDADSAVASLSGVPMPAPLFSFDGLSSSDDAAAYGFRAVPPDPNGDVGPNHYVQAVNILTRVFDKSGSALTPPFKLSSIFSVLGTPCSTRNDGDPVVLYDPLTDRWMLSQFCNNFPPFRQLIAVSQTSDPTGSFYVYEFVMPNVKFNDYPKIGVWSDGFYMSTDEYLGSDYAGSGVFAFDKKKMIAGDRAANYVYFDLASPSTIRLGGLLPSDFDGLNAPPANAPNTFVGYTANEYGDAADTLRLFDFHADFVNPQNSTFSERAESPLPVAPFDPTSPDGRADIDEPPPGEKLDSQSDRLMFRAAYRNLGAQESLVVNQTVRVSPAGQTYRAGVRLYELRKTAGAFTVREQSTIGSGEASRWMGSAAQDYQGNLAVGYSFSSELKNPSILYSGKLASEPQGTFRTEGTLIAGTGAQNGFGSRWGDYSAMNVDPSDDCTFWYTQEYYTKASETENPYGWLTRIGKFRFPECQNAPRATINGTVTDAATGQPIPGASVAANAVYIRSTNGSGDFGDLILVPNTYVLSASANGFITQNVTAKIADGQILTQNFALEPTAVLQNAGVEITSESCALNHAIDPSETVTLSISLRNTGARNTTDLTATLLATGGILNPSEPQNYGVLNANGAGASRLFTFTASPYLHCGDAITLTLQLQDGAENLGTVTINLNTGAARIALQENFDSVTAPNSPNGWQTFASGAEQPWKTSSVVFKSPPNSAYSSSAVQSGVNELVSPVFHVNSPNAELTFQNRYDLETTFLRNQLYDGAVLEIKTGRGAFQDILAAGGVFLSGGYDGVLSNCCQNPLAGRLAWSGISGANQTPEFITSRVRLPASLAGKNVQLRWRVGTDNGTSREGEFIDDVKVSDGFVCGCQSAKINRTPFDFDGDGKTDFSVFRASDDVNEPDFRVENSSDKSQIGTAWGSVGDAAVNADYDGDGKTDYAVFRPSTRTWFVLQSSDNTIIARNFGFADDKLVPADYDGDGRADIAVYRPSTGFWYILQSSDGQMRSIQFGASSDSPVQADYDGDGKIDIAVFRPANGFWYALRSSDGGILAAQFGQSGDRPVAGDFDGDGQADFVVFRPSSGIWYLLKSTVGFSAIQFGASNDKPLQADFDGDGKRDIAVYRQSTGGWYYLKSSDGGFVASQFGANGDTATPAIFVP